MRKDDREGLSDEILSELADWLSANPEPSYPDPMQPPWLQFPDLDRRSVGWRMGPGEEYLLAFAGWFRQLGTDRRTSYREDNPEPEDWLGFYELLPTRDS